MLLFLCTAWFCLIQVSHRRGLSPSRKVFRLGDRPLSISIAGYCSCEDWEPAYSVPTGRVPVSAVGSIAGKLLFVYKALCLNSDRDIIILIIIIMAGENGCIEISPEELKKTTTG